jgi:hypothetical protein
MNSVELDDKLETMPLNNFQKMDRRNVLARFPESSGRNPMLVSGAWTNAIDRY